MFNRIALILLGVLTASSVHATEFLVKQRAGMAINLASMPGVRVLDLHPAGNLLKVDIPETSKAKILAQLFDHSSVEYVVPNFKLRAFRAPPSAQALQEQWALKKVNAEKAWRLAGNKGSQRVLVAVIDTGVDYNHESLKTNMVAGYDFKEDTNDPMDQTSSKNPGHGTHCAGIVGATGLVDGGVIGISPEVSIMPLRFLGADGGGDLMNGIKAIDYAIEKGASVISASWGARVSRAQAQPLIDAVKRASDAGVIFVVAAANDGRSNDTTEVYPANAIFPNTITVAASGPEDEKPSWSNYGKRTVSLAAPGLTIMSTLPGNKYDNLSGTSMATPLVAGLVALLKAQDPNISGADVRSLLQVTGAKAAVETACDCRIDAGAAMEALLQKEMWVSPAAMTIAPNETQSFKAVNGQPPFRYESSDAAVAKVDDDGVLTALSEGETTVKITDASGRTASSLTVRIAKAKKEGGGGGGGTPGQCPIGDQKLCDILCKITPNMPWCK